MLGDGAFVLAVALLRLGHQILDGPLQVVYPLAHLVDAGDDAVAHLLESRLHLRQQVLDLRRVAGAGEAGDLRRPLDEKGDDFEKTGGEPSERGVVERGASRGLGGDGRGAHKGGKVRGGLGSLSLVAHVGLDRAREVPRPGEKQHSLERDDQTGISLYGI